MINNKKYAWLFTLIILFVLMQVDLSAQCAMCKQAAETSLKNDPKSMVRSLNSGILYLMVVPYLAIMFIFRKQLLQLLRHLLGKAPKPEAE